MNPAQESNRNITRMLILAILALCVSAIHGFREGYVIGGEDTTIEKWPFMVSLQSPNHFCGGSLFDTTHVVTAGHCVYGASPASITVQLGTNSVDNPGSDGNTYQELDLAEIVIHADYESYYLDDIALLLLATEADISGDNVALATLAPSDSEDFSNSECEIAGWGRTEDDSSPDILQETPIGVITVEECQDFYDFADESHICLLDDNGETSGCFGDSGGPLTCINSDGDRVLAGVTSGGSDECDPSVAAHYTRISYFYDWIQDNL